jgi:uncharacterized protein
MVPKLLSRKTRRYLWQFALAMFLVLNILAFTGAYLMSHFSAPGQWGNQRPMSSKTPGDIGLAYVTQSLPLNTNEWVETWSISAAQGKSQGTVLLFPGNGSSKATQLLAPAKVFHDLHYDTLLVDFRGVGGSSGNTTTLGVNEAKDVALAMGYIEGLKLQRPVVLYGISMGSAAILTAIAKENVKPDGIILELPFARSIDAVRSRVRKFHAPTFPLAELIVFWGGLQHGFNGFDHNPVTYASQVKCPTLIMQGSLDQWTSIKEIQEILQNLRGAKELLLFPNTGHTLLVTVDKARWQSGVDRFLSRAAQSLTSLESSRT